MRGVIAECEYAPGLPFVSDTFAPAIRISSAPCEFFRICAARNSSQAVRPSGLQRQCDRAKGSQRRPGETTQLSPVRIFFAMLLAARGFAVSRVAVVARPSRFAREGAPSGFASASPRRVIKSEGEPGRESFGYATRSRQRRARAAKRRRSRASYCRPLSFVHYRNRAQPARRD